MFKGKCWVHYLRLDFCIKIPELDVSISNSNEIASIFRKRDATDLQVNKHFVSVLIKTNRKMARFILFILIITRNKNTNQYRREHGIT